MYVRVVKTGRDEPTFEIDHVLTLESSHDLFVRADADNTLAVNRDGLRYAAARIGGKDFAVDEYETRGQHTLRVSVERQTDEQHCERERESLAQSFHVQLA